MSLCWTLLNYWGSERCKDGQTQYLVHVSKEMISLLNANSYWLFRLLACYKVPTFAPSLPCRGWRRGEICYQISLTLFMKRSYVQAKIPTTSSSWERIFWRSQLIRWRSSLNKVRSIHFLCNTFQSPNLYRLHDDLTIKASQRRLITRICWSYRSVWYLMILVQNQTLCSTL